MDLVRDARWTVVDSRGDRHSYIPSFVRIGIGGLNGGVD